MVDDPIGVAETMAEPAASRRRSIQRWLAVAVWAALIGGYLYYMRSRGLTALQAAEELRAILADNWWGPALYIAAYAVRPLVLFPATVLTIVGGLAFGLGWGTVWTVVASNLSTAVAYAVGRYVLSGPAAERIVALIGSLVQRARRNPFEATAIMRLLYLPYDAVGYGAGLIRLPFLPFLAGSFLGTLPGTVAFVGFGASVESLDEGAPSFDLRVLAASVALALAGSLLSRFLKARSTESETTCQHP